MRLFVLLVLGVIVAVIVYVRLAPDNTAGVHIQAEPRGPGDYPTSVRFLAVRQITAAPEDVLRAITQAAMDRDRTKALAGTVDDGMVTFVTRSKLMGFPDYTTVSIIPADTVDNAGPLVMIDARLRYGKNDLGVNKARVASLLDALGPLTVPLDSDSTAQ
jgi:uncharacterized protein (DUF1499 family)